MNNGVNFGLINGYRHNVPPPLQFLCFFLTDKLIYLFIKKFHLDSFLKLGNSALVISLLEVLRIMLTLKTGKRMPLNGNILTTCVEKSIPC